MTRPRDWMDPLRERMFEEADRIIAAQRQEREAREAQFSRPTDGSIYGVICAAAAVGVIALWIVPPALFAAFDMLTGG